MSKFKVGDKIRRVKPSEVPEQFGEVGEEYIVLALAQKRNPIVVEGAGSAEPTAFELVEDTKVTQKFKVGDRVKCLHPVVVSSTFKGLVGVVKEVYEDETLLIEYDHPTAGTKCPQDAYVKDDGVLHVDSVEQDSVNSPSHYNESGIECIEAIRASLGPIGFQAYCKGNCIKYLWRYQYKNGLEDLRKAQVYLNWMVESAEENGID